MGIFDKILGKVAHDAVEGMIEDMKEDSRPYFYLIVLPFGGPDQDVPKEASALPPEVLDSAKEHGGFLSIESQIIEPEEDEYLNGVLCTFHARSRMEAAGAILAFSTMNDERIEMAVMQNVISEVAGLKDSITEDGKPSEAADQIYEFTKTETGDLIIAFPTQSDDGQMDYSGCFVTLRAPRRTDSEVARMVLQASNTIYSGALTPALMASLHRDIGAYGVIGSHTPWSNGE